MAGSGVVIEKQASSLIEFGWAIKDSLSKYIYVNDLACSHFNTSSKEIIGYSDIDLVPDIRDFYKYIRNDDKKIIANQKMSIALKIF